MSDRSAGLALKRLRHGQDLLKILQHIFLPWSECAKFDREIKFVYYRLEIGGHLI